MNAEENQNGTASRTVAVFGDVADAAAVVRSLAAHGVAAAHGSLKEPARSLFELRPAVAVFLASPTSLPPSDGMREALAGLPVVVYGDADLRDRSLFQAWSIQAWVDPAFGGGIHRVVLSVTEHLE